MLNTRWPPTGCLWISCYVMLTNCGLLCAAVQAERLVAKAVKARDLRDDTTCIIIIGGRPEDMSLGSLIPGSQSSNSLSPPGLRQGLRRSLLPAVASLGLRLRPAGRNSQGGGPEHSVKSGNVFGSLMNSPGLTSCPIVQSPTQAGSSSDDDFGASDSPVGSPALFQILKGGPRMQLKPGNISPSSSSNNLQLEEVGPTMDGGVGGVGIMSAEAIQRLKVSL